MLITIDDTAMYTGVVVNGKFASDEPKCLVVGDDVPNASYVPYDMAAAQPASNAQRWNQRVYSPATIARNVCMIQTPPSNWKLSAFCRSRNSTNASAPNFTTRDESLE